MPDRLVFARVRRFACRGAASSSRRASTRPGGTPSSSRSTAGPGAPTVLDRWGGHSYCSQLLLKEGYLVASIDNRSATAASRAHETSVEDRPARIHLFHKMLEFWKQRL
jgi:hypothetical protein